MAHQLLNTAPAANPDTRHGVNGSHLANLIANVGAMNRIAYLWRDPLSRLIVHVEGS
jgi:hypothetical protein